MKNLLRLKFIGLFCVFALVLSSFNRPYYPVNCEFTLEEAITQNDLPLKMVKLYYLYGEHRVFYYNDYLAAFKYCMLAKGLINKHDLQHHPIHGAVCRRLGSIYYYFGDYKKSIQYLLNWHKHIVKCEKQIYVHYLTLGLAYHHLGEIEKSQQYLYIGLFYAYNLNNGAWVAILIGNMAKNYEAQGETLQAIEFHWYDYQNSALFDNYISQITSLLSISRIRSNYGDWSFFETWEPEIQRLQIIDKSKPLPEYYKLKSEYHEFKGQDNLALNNYKKYEYYKDSIADLKSKTKLDAAKLKILEGHAINDLEEIEIKMRRTKNWNHTLIAITIAAALSILVIIVYQKLRIKRLKEISEKRQASVKAKLLESNSIVERKMMEIEEKNKIIDQLESLKNKAPQNLSRPEILNQLANTKILTNEHWENFQKEFSIVYPDFLLTLKAQYPEMTEAEKRLACLIRLNLSNYEIGNILGISKDSVRKTSLRLRARLTINGSHEDLLAFIFKINT